MLKAAKERAVWMMQVMPVKNTVSGGFIECLCSNLDGTGAVPFGLVPFGLVPFGLVPSGLGPVGLLYCLVYCTFWSTVPFGLGPYGLLYHLV